MGEQRQWRFADGPTTSVTRVVPAPPADVWARVSDIGLPAETSDELQRVEWVDDGDVPRVGARFLGHNARGELRWTTTSVVTECEPNRAFAWDVWVDPDHDEHGALSSWRFDLEAVDGGTRTTQSVRLGPGRSGLTWAIRQAPERESELIAGRLAQFEDAMRATLDALP